VGGMNMMFVADNSFGDDLGDGVAGPVGLLIIVLLCIGTALLVRNMNKRLKRLPASFPDPQDAYNGTKPRTPLDDATAQSDSADPESVA
jgi:hypothetical protein